MKSLFTKISVFFSLLIVLFSFKYADWQSKFIKLTASGKIEYAADQQGNTIPDFSRVGYHQGDKAFPKIPVVKTISASQSDDRETIQQAIDELSKKEADKNGYRGTILLKKGSYKISSALKINASGIVLQGEGNDKDGTRLIATSKEKSSLIVVSGQGSLKEISNTRKKITTSYVPLGATSFEIAASAGLKVGDQIVVFRPGTQNWISDLKMDQIVERQGTKQWQGGGEYDLKFERKITKIIGNTISIDNPIVMAMETKYGGGEIYKSSFEGRISEVGVENIRFESEFAHDTDENHAWVAVEINKAENCWVKNVVSYYFANSCVSVGKDAKYITVTDSKCFDAKSVITGSRRYSFNNDGQLNLFMNLETTEGRHDFVTGARVLGPNVFYNCKSSKTHADIGPHHRWAVGTLYDNVSTDGQINAQDRGKMGSGHGWSGANQVFWNCTAKEATIQNPWVSAKNYAIGLQGKKSSGSIPDREDGEWEGQNKPGLTPKSLYTAQLNARQN